MITIGFNTTQVIEAQNIKVNIVNIDSTKRVLPIRSTKVYNANEQLLYFTSTSLLSDDRHLIFLSDRSGFPNIFMRDLKTGGNANYPLIKMVF